DGIRDLIVTGVQTCALPISEGELDEATEPRRPGQEMQPVDQRRKRAMSSCVSLETPGEEPDGSERREEGPPRTPHPQRRGQDGEAEHTNDPETSPARRGELDEHGAGSHARYFAHAESRH